MKAGKIRLLVPDALSLIGFPGHIPPSTMFPIGAERMRHHLAIPLIEGHGRISSKILSVFKEWLNFPRTYRQR
jgi:hypothetical protein